MSASAERIFEVGMPFDQTIALVKQILSEIAAVINDSDEQRGVFVAMKMASARSFGETIEIRVEAIPDKGCRIHAKSKSTSDTVDLDLGVNEENIAAFARSLTFHLAPPSATPASVSDLTPLLAPASAWTPSMATYPSAQQADPALSRYALRPMKDKSLAIILETLPGLFGFLGFGWFYSGNSSSGVAWLVGMLVWDIVAAVIVVGTAGFGCLCTLPVSVGLIALSTSRLNGYARAHPELFGA